MKIKLERLEKTVENVQKEVVRHDTEIDELRKFKHATNGTLHTHNGKLDVISTQQSNTAEAITELTLVVKDAVKKLNALMTVKWMVMGAGIIFVPTVTGMIFLFKLYMESKGLK